MMVFEWAKFVVAAFFMIAGLIVLFGATLGLYRFKYVLNRIHVTATSDTFGLLLTFISLMIMYGWTPVTLKILLVIVFLWIANPVSSHLIAHIEIATNPRLDEECEVIRQDDDG